MGCCEDYLTCDIAFNAVMPLSRASTRGSYSRIEGVTDGLEGEGEEVDREDGSGDHQTESGQVYILVKPVLTS